MYAFKSWLVSVNEADEDGVLHTIEADLYPRKGDLIATDQNGRTSLISRELLENELIPVEKVQSLVEKPKKKNPFESMSEEQLSEAYGQSWVNNDVDESDLAMLAEYRMNKAF